MSHARARRTIVLLIATGLIAFIGMRWLGRRPLPFEPVRFVDALRGVDDPLLEWSTTAALGEESRPVLFATRALGVEADCGDPRPEPVRMCQFPLSNVPPGPWVVAESEPRGGGAKLVTPIRRRATRRVARASAYVSPQARTARVSARPVPDPSLLDITTARVRIPARGVLRFGLGVEEAAWRDGFPPTEFTITVLDGGSAHEMFRRVVDPARSPAERRWLDERIDLTALAGRNVRLRFAARPGGGDTGPILPLWADPVLLGPLDERGRPNVLLVSLDTLRAKSVSAYGSARRTMPALEDLAAQGVLFEHTIAPYPHTLPSHMSLFTALYPHTHGILLDPEVRLAPEHRTLPEVLRAAGYETAAFTEDGWVVRGAGFERGFARYVEDRTTASLRRVTGSIEKTFENGLAWLRDRGERPFFLFLHTYQVHWPYVPPPAYLAFFADEQPETPADTDEQLRYEQDIRYADDQIGRLLRELDRLGLAERTLVIVTSDHGEEFREHGGLQHGDALYDESLRVPLVMRLPAVVPAGRRVTTPVSLIDVAPTILDLLGIAPLRRAEGISLVPLLRGGTVARTTVFAEARRLIAVRTATHKCIVNTARASSQYDCFDVVRDPAERNRLDVDRDGGSARDAIAALDAVVATIVTASAPGGREIPRETQEKIRALGYVQ